MAFDEAIAAITIATEASGEAPLTRRAIAWSLRNRLQDGRFGETLAEVCLRREQFSAWNGDAVNNKNLCRVARTEDEDLVIADCLAAVTEVMAVGSIDPTCGATHFYEASIQAPSWTVSATMTAKIGSFVFWRNVK